jgi:hypothetical protein
VCGGKGDNEGAERVHPRDCPAHRGYEVHELERGYRCNREVYSRMCVTSSTRTRLPIPDSARSASYDHITKMRTGKVSRRKI